MNSDIFHKFCAALPHTTNVVQWGGADVWKIGGKVFAIGWNDPFAVTFKAGEIGYEVLQGEEGYIPAPYFASRGLKWIRAEGTVDGEELAAHIKYSYHLVGRGLSKKKQIELGLIVPN